jgi:N-acetylglucosaminyl-diphospho-decaprenol L-rhamnosyltransferase
LADQVDVIVSIVTHDATDRTLLCLESLTADSARTSSADIVVLDNDSDPPAGPEIRRRFPSVRLLEQQFRAGFGANHNTVIRSTRSRYVFVLNNDTTVPPETIDVLVRYLDAHPEVAIVAPRILHPDGHEQAAAFRFPTPAASFLFAATLGQVGMVQSGTRTPRAVDWVTGAAMVIRREAFERVGGFDEGFFMYHEETDLCRRLADIGYETHYVPTVTVVHDRWGTTGDDYRRRVDEARRSRRRYWAKHHGPVGARAAAFADAFRYALAAAAASVVDVAPNRLRPHHTRGWSSRVWWYTARSALRRSEGEGLRELAEAHNAARRRRGPEHESAPPVGRG